MLNSNIVQFNIDHSHDSRHIDSLVEPCCQPVNHFRTGFFQEAQREISQYTLLVTVDARLPVANFGYQGGPSRLCTHLADDKLWEFDQSGGAATDDQPWPVEVLRLLALQLGATPQAVRPGINCRGVFCPPIRPTMPPGASGFECRCG